MFPNRLLPLFLASVLAAPATVARQDPAPYLSVDRQDERGVLLSVRIPPPAVDVSVAADGFRQVRIDGLGRVSHPGHPELPVLVASVGIPDGAELRVSHSSRDEWVSAGPPVQPVAGVDAETREAVRTPDATVYGDSAPWPGDRVVVEEVRFRGLRLARVLVYPVRYVPGAGELRVASALDIELEFIGGRGFQAAGGALGPVEQRLLQDLANRESVLAQLRSRAALEHTEDRTRFEQAPIKAMLPAGPAVKIRVGSAGIVRVTRADLAAAGFATASVDPRNLELSYRGTPVPCRVVGESDAGFDSGDSIEFYGVPGTGRFSESNVYWLEEKAAPGLRYATRDASPDGAPAAVTFPSTERYEEGNKVYDFGENVEEGDPHFFWAWFDANNSIPPRTTKLTHVAPLPGVDVSGPQATMRAFFSGQTDPVENPDHRVQFSVNGAVVGESTWNGQTFHTAEIDFNAGLLQEGDNTFEIELLPVAVIDAYYLDWFEVDYPRSLVAAAERLTIVGEGETPTRYDVDGFGPVSDALVLDVTDPLVPVQLTGAQIVSGAANVVRFEDVPGGRSYAIAGDDGRIAPEELILDTPSDLRDTAGGGDLIIVVPDGWESALAPLVAHRQAQGLRVVLAGLTDVADEFSGGNVDDLAIRNFARYAFENWQAPAPSFLLLVGEPNLDPLNHLERSPFDHWMPTHFGVTEALGETLSDNWFGAVAGDDLLPDIAVGRWSVRSASAAADLTAKVIDYETEAGDGAAWRSNVVRVASTSALFEQALENATAFLPGHFTVDTEYRLANASTSSIQSSINAGAAVVSFVGHGNVASWSDVPGGSFFTASAAQALANTGRLPFVTALNCLNGLVGHPTLRDSLAEVLVNDPTKGAIASWSPSGLGFLSEFDALQTVLYRTLFLDHRSRIGAATTEALVQTYLNNPVDIDLITKMVFTGDPSNFLAVDSDNDQVLDFDEVSSGMDPGDRDSDDDGLLDGAEGGAATDTDGDGTVNALDPDSDNDGLLDGLESGVVAPDTDTDVSRGRFRADAHPASTTDPFDADTDDGGAPDGVEDLDADGAVDASETDPQITSDDPVCSTAAPAELATTPDSQLTLARSGMDTVLTWGAASEVCVLYRVYVADGSSGSDGEGAFALANVSGLPAYTETSPSNTGTLRLYLVVGSTPAGGEGAWGHFDR